MCSEKVCLHVQIEILKRGHCEVSVRKRWPVLNHLGTIHAIALCNAVEMAAGMLTEATVASHLRWIPIGMTVQYKRKADTKYVKAVAKITRQQLEDWNLREDENKVDVMVPVNVYNEREEIVLSGTVTMQLSRKKKTGSDKPVAKL